MYSPESEDSIHQLTQHGSQMNASTIPASSLVSTEPNSNHVTNGHGGHDNVVMSERDDVIHTHDEDDMVVVSIQEKSKKRKRGVQYQIIVM